MRLTKSIKEVILNNWKTKKHNNIEEKLKTSIKKELSVLFKKEYKKQFDIYNNNKDIQEYLLTHSYFKCDRLYNLGFMNSANVSCDRYVSSSRYDQEYLTNTEEVSKIVKKHTDKYKKYKEESKTITFLMESVTTVKKLVDILPEIEKYIPKTASTTTLIAASDLAKAKQAL